MTRFSIRDIRQILAAYRGGRSLGDIAWAWDVPVAPVRGLLDACGVEIRPAASRDPGRDAETVAAHRAGETLQSIGERLGVSRERVRQIVLRAGGRGARRTTRDAALWSAIAAALPASRSSRELAAAVGCPVTHLYALLHQSGEWERSRAIWRAAREAKRATRRTELLAALRALAARLGRPPITDEHRAAGISDISLQRLFGDVRSAYDAAGIHRAAQGDSLRHWHAERKVAANV